MELVAVPSPTRGLLRKEHFGTEGWVQEEIVGWCVLPLGTGSPPVTLR